MKDIIITRHRQKVELSIYLVCFIIAVGFNIYAINKYDAPWTEIFTGIGFELLGASVLYAVIGIIRIIVYLIRKIKK